MYKNKKEKEMKIGLIVLSLTGNTMKVAHQLQEELKHLGIKSEILAIETTDDFLTPESTVIKNQVDLSIHDYYVLCTPVHGFLPPKLIQSFLRDTSQTEKIVGLLVTHYFPYAWMGGLSTIKAIQKQCEPPLNKERITLIINWKRKNLEEQITRGVRLFATNLSRL
jgi:flavorubredoxin